MSGDRIMAVRMSAYHIPQPIESLQGDSMLRVVAENQNEAPDAFRPWYRLTGLYEGRLGYEGMDTAAGNPMASSQGPIQHSMDDNPSWCNCNALPFSMPAPASLFRAVNDALDVSYASYADSERCKPPLP